MVSAYTRINEGNSVPFPDLVDSSVVIFSRNSLIFGVFFYDFILP